MTRTTKHDEPGIIAMLIEDVPEELHYKELPCTVCKRLCSISKASHNAISYKSRKYVVICIRCFAEKGDELDVGKVTFTKEQLEEMARSWQIRDRYAS